MKKIEKDLIMGVIKSATHKAAKFFEKGIMVSDSQFQEILEACTTYNHLWFGVEAIKIQFGENHRGKPSVEIICRAEGYRFLSSFIIDAPHYKFSNTLPMAQYFNVEVLDDFDN